ncbi:hypothetical protein GIB67_031596 [Kingdonia uniflora]|uniref:Uncharacterized protein n=1 Tax=Kingdonia uniflora TaxID=39325 RepID=A0A7J7LYA8_9MAGN|nr:hypothetical protein GIB67_031596 [Kingdonia uniflora]
MHDVISYHQGVLFAVPVVRDPEMLNVNRRLVSRADNTMLLSIPDLDEIELKLKMKNIVLIMNNSCLNLRKKCANQFCPRCNLGFVTLFCLGFVMSSNVAEGSREGSTGRYRPANSTDPGWDYGQPVDGNRDHVKYDFCGHVSKGGIKRLKQHLVKASYKGTLYKDVRKCDKVPQDVVDLLRSFMEGKQKATEDKQNKKDEMIRNVNVYGNDDEVEEVGIQIPKKRKEPMDAFVAPIDVDFHPRAPTSNENKKALENIHGYIADFFYENIISFNCIHTKKRNCLEHDRIRDLTFIQYNKRLKKRYEERISGEEIDPIVLKSLNECVECLVPDDARDDIVLGTDITYGVLEDAEDGFDDPSLTRTSRTNTTSHCLQGGASSSRSTTRHLQDSSDDDDYDVDANYDVGDGDDDGIDSGSDEDI